MLVQTWPTAGLSLAVGRLDNGMLVLDDVITGKRLGPVDLISRFAVPMGARDGILLAGFDEHAITVTVEWGRDDREELETRQGVWITTPRTFVPGTSVSVHWHQADGEQRFTTIGPLQKDDLIPDRPAWQAYAPGSD